MTTETERAYISDENAWEVYMGGATPAEVGFGFDSAEAAIKEFLEDRYPYPWGVDKPSWLMDALLRYAESHKNA